MSGLKSWNFWTPINGTLYGWRAYHPDDYLLVLQGAAIRPRVILAYTGKTIQNPWTKRAEQHAWGGGRYDSKPQPWADTVLGWTPNGTVDDLIAAGGVFTIWQGRTVPLLLSWGEVLIAIKLRRPHYNYHWNQGNSRRIPIYEAENQRELRDLARGVQTLIPARTRPRSGSRTQRGMLHAAVVASPLALRVSNVPRWFGYYRRWLTAVILAGLVVLFIPGMPGAEALRSLWQTVLANQTQLIGGGVLLAALLLAGPRILRPKHRKRRRARRRR